MKRLMIGLFAALLAGTAQAQEAVGSRPSIAVVGVGTAEAMPDRFKMTAELEGRGQDQLDATRQLSILQARVFEGLKQLEGLETARVATGLPQIEATHAPTCGDDYGSDKSNCPVTGYRASMTVTLSGGPVARGGDAVSLAGELGATGAALSSVFLSSETALKAQATRAAYADARRQANSLAAASGQRIVRVLLVQDPAASLENDKYVEDVVVTAQRRRATVPLNFEPAPVQISVRLTVIFEIE